MVADSFLQESDQRQDTSLQATSANLSSDLPPLDSMLWGYLKARVHKNKPTMIQQLYASIKEKKLDFVAMAGCDSQQLQLAPPLAMPGSHLA